MQRCTTQHTTHVVTHTLRKEDPLNTQTPHPRRRSRLPALALGGAQPHDVTLLSPWATQAQTVAQRLRALEAKLACVHMEGTTLLVIEGCTLAMQHGLYLASATKGTGNLISGYNKGTGTLYYHWTACL